MSERKGAIKKHPSNDGQLVKNGNSSDGDTDLLELMKNNTDDTQVNSVLYAYNINMNKNLQAKKRQMATFTDSTIKKSKQCVFPATQDQRATRKKNLEEFEKTFKQCVNVMEVNIGAAKETEAKMQKQILNLQKQHQQITIVCQEHLKKLNSLTHSFIESSRAMESQHETELEAAQATLNTEMQALQAQMLADIQKEGLRQMKQSLDQSMMLL